MSQRSIPQQQRAGGTQDATFRFPAKGEGESSHPTMTSAVEAQVFHNFARQIAENLSSLSENPEIVWNRK